MEDLDRVRRKQSTSDKRLSVVSVRLAQLLRVNSPPVSG